MTNKVPALTRTVLSRTQVAGPLPRGLVITHTCLCKQAREPGSVLFICLINLKIFKGVK